MSNDKDLRVLISNYAKQADAIQTKMRSFVEKWGWIATSMGWKFDVFYCMASEDMPEGHEDAAGVTFHRFQYLSGEIYFNVRKLKDESDTVLEEVVLHELTHFLLSAYDDREVRLMEYTTTAVARMLKAAAERDE